MTINVDLNCDMGESFGRYILGQDDEVLQYVTSANIACGYHAGDPPVIDKTVSMAGQHKVGIGAHPSYPDLQGFGRRYMEVDEEDLKSFLVYQIGALQTMARIHGYPLQHVKLHGALYLQAAVNDGLASLAADVIASIGKDIIFLAQAGTEMIRAGEEAGLKTAQEFFSDRNYDDEGKLLSRKHAQAMVEKREEAVERAIRVLTDNIVITPWGNKVNLGKVDTICIHGDTPTTVSFAYDLRNKLEKEGINVKPLAQFL